MRVELTRQWFCRPWPHHFGFSGLCMFCDNPNNRDIHNCLQQGTDYENDHLFCHELLRNPRRGLASRDNDGLSSLQHYTQSVLTPAPYRVFNVHGHKIWWTARDLNPAGILGASEANTPSISAAHVTLVFSRPFAYPMLPTNERRSPNFYQKYTSCYDPHQSPLGT